MMGTRRRASALLAVLGMAAAGCWGPTEPAGGEEPPPAYAGHDSATYRDPANWVCRPDKAGDLCRRGGSTEGGQDTTRVSADGKLREVPWKPARHPAVDCFYVYPTSSNDPGVNSDRSWSVDEEGMVTELQAARFGSACRVFAPAYRSVTVTAFTDGRFVDPAAEPTAYADVADAWRHYVANHNHGRGVILIGHSQGAVMGARLLREEIEPNPGLRSRLVGAYLLGRPTFDPFAGPAGGSFSTPVCERFGQVRCVVAYSAFRSTIPPGLLSIFGRDPSLVDRADCANPAALTRPLARPGDAAWLTPMIPVDRQLGEPPPGPWVDPAYGEVTTPFATPVRFLEARCVARAGFHFLEVTVHGDPADPRVDDIGGDVEVPGLFGKDVYGLHQLDANLALGDLVRLARIQAFAYLVS